MICEKSGGTVTFNNTQAFMESSCMQPSLRLEILRDIQCGIGTGCDHQYFGRMEFFQR